MPLNRFAHLLTRAGRSLDFRRLCRDLLPVMLRRSRLQFAFEPYVRNRRISVIAP
jgi:hypothetical protein